MTTIFRSNPWTINALRKKIEYHKAYYKQLVLNVRLFIVNSSQLKRAKIVKSNCIYVVFIRTLQKS